MVAVTTAGALFRNTTLAVYWVFGSRAEFAAQFTALASAVSGVQVIGTSTWPAPTCLNKWKAVLIDALTEATVAGWLKFTLNFPVGASVIEMLVTAKAAVLKDRASEQSPVVQPSAFKFCPDPAGGGESLTAVAARTT